MDTPFYRPDQLLAAKHDVQTQTGPVIDFEPLEVTKPTSPLTSFHTTILRALQDKPLYLGTVTYATKVRNRARAKVAKRSRKINRGR